MNKPKIKLIDRRKEWEERLILAEYNTVALLSTFGYEPFKKVSRKVIDSVEDAIKTSTRETFTTNLLASYIERTKKN